MPKFAAIYGGICMIVWYIVSRYLLGAEIVDCVKIGFLAGIFYMLFVKIYSE